MHGYGGQPVRFERDAEVVLIPGGERVSIPSGTVGYLTQSLGGSYTIYIEGNLFRLAGADAEAIGKTPPPAIELPAGAGDEDVEALVWEQLKSCYDPEIPVNIVDLGLVYRCAVRPGEPGGRTVEIDMTLTAPGCGMGEILAEDVRQRVEAVPTVDEAKVNLVFDPPWNYSMMSEAARLETGML